MVDLFTPEPPIIQEQAEQRHERSERRARINGNVEFSL